MTLKHSLWTRSNLAFPRHESRSPAAHHAAPALQMRRRAPQRLIFMPAFLRPLPKGEMKGTCYPLVGHTWGRLFNLPH